MSSFNLQMLLTIVLHCQVLSFLGTTFFALLAEDLILDLNLMYLLPDITVPFVIECHGCILLNYVLGPGI